MEKAQIIVVALAAIAFVIYRQTTPRPAARRAGLIISVALILGGLASDGAALVDPLHPVLAVTLLVSGLLVAAGLGALRATTTRVWRDPHGVAWSQGTGLTLLAWAGSIAARIAMMALTALLGVATSQGSILVFVGVTLGVQFLIVARRANALPGAAVPDAYAAR
ncbi:hypothetical protein AB0C10_01685 [Microbispora amethystogenes]|uniref:hypothetical protein n=1 Tax=Microbispora amethystogenes TaxID=1427754 RepID=UPI0033CED731